MIKIKIKKKPSKIKGLMKREGKSFHSLCYEIKHKSDIDDLLVPGQECPFHALVVVGAKIGPGVSLELAKCKSEK